MDLHSHLLPGLDDGAATMEETRRFARRLDAEGVRRRRLHPAHQARALPADRHRRAGRPPRGRAARDRRRRARRPPAPGGELADEDALELDEHELALIAQGPEHAPLAAARVPVRGARRRLRRRRRAPDRPRLRPPARPPRARRRPARPARAARRDRRAAAGQRLARCSAITARRRARPRARLVRHGLAYCLASRYAPGHAREHAPARLSGARALRRRARSQAQRLTRSNPRFLLREGNPASRAAAPQRRSAALTTKVGSTS